MSINALPSFTPQVINAQGAHPVAAGFPMLPQDLGNPVLASIQQFSQLMLQKPKDSDETDSDDAAL